MIRFDANKLSEEISNEYELSKKKEALLRDTLKKLGYKNCSICGKNTMEKEMDKTNLLISIVSYSYTSSYGYSLSYSIGIKTQDEAVKYIADVDKSGNWYYISGLINYVLTNKKTIIFEAELIWSKNQLQFSWKDKQFEEMISYLIETDEMLSKKYIDLKHIVSDYFEEIKCHKNLLEQNGKLYNEHSQDYGYLSILYYLFGDKSNTIITAEKALMLYQKQSYILPHRILQKKAYLDYLKHGTSLPYIPSPADKSSIFQLIGNDIYVAINKKAIKNENILEYFGGIDNFEKPQKITYKDMVNEAGISICKVGKWSVLRMGLDIFMNYTQKDLEQLLSTLSEKYSRSILLVNQDTSGTFGFEVYKKGEFIRRWMAGDGEVMENLGKPITGEKKRFGDTLTEEQDTESVVSFLDGILKITYGDLEKSKTLLYDMK